VSGECGWLGSIPVYLEDEVGYVAIGCVVLDGEGWC
jgi:hypothetical protein